MKFAHVLIPDFAIQVEILSNPALRRKPVVIGTAESRVDGQSDEQGAVYARSPAAQRAGVKLGMKLRQAEQLAAEAVFLPANEQAYAAAHRSLMTYLEMFSPLRQAVALGEICLEASGLEGLYGPDSMLVEQLSVTVRQRTKLMSKVGLASNRFTAAVAAELAPLGEGQVVARGAEAEFLAPLGIAALVPSDAAIGLLTQLGVVTLRQVAELPPGALSRTLGTEGERLHRLARGLDRTPLVPEFEQAPLSARVSLDWQLEDLATLAAYADVLIGQLTGELAGAGLAAGNLIVEVEQQDGRLRTAWGTLRPASNDRQKLIERAVGLLERMKYSNGVTGLTISLSPLQAQHLGIRQIPIDDGNALTPDPLGHTLDTIRVRFGAGSIRDAATLPGPPPEPVDVRCGPDGQPGSMLRDGRWTRFESVQLHWRMEGDWWSSGGLGETPDQWRGNVELPGPPGRKDYYQVVTRGGKILVLLNLVDRWYLHTAAKPSTWPVM